MRTEDKAIWAALVAFYWALFAMLVWALQ